MEKNELHQRNLIDLRREIQIGIDQAERSEVSAFNEATLEEAKRLGRKKLNARKDSKST